MFEAQPPAAFQCFLRKLKSLAVLSGDDESALFALPIVVENWPARHDLVRSAEARSSCYILLDGFVCRYKCSPDGQRQILSFHPPGDVPDLESMLLNTMDYAVQTMVPSTVGRVSHNDLFTLTQRHPGLARAFRRDAAVDGAIFRQWMLGLGRRNVREHLAHMLCEMVMRFRAAGLRTTDLPLAYADMADAVGASPVQVTRELQQLRREGMIRFGPRVVQVLDFLHLSKICAFDPAYLHQNQGT